jgi:uncharacterized iron-regulated protein
MKRAIQHFNTCVILAWVLGSVLWMAGEPEGNLLPQILGGLTSLGLALAVGNELMKRGLMLNDYNEENDNF